MEYDLQVFRPRRQKDEIGMRNKCLQEDGIYYKILSNLALLSPLSQNNLTILCGYRKDNGNQIGNAICYLKKRKMIQRIKKGRFIITLDGKIKLAYCQNLILYQRNMKMIDEVRKASFGLEGD